MDTTLRRGLALALLLGMAAAAPGRLHKDDRWGYKVKVPGGWITAALSADEEWIASKHFAEREQLAKKTIWYASARPEMWVVGFPHARMKDQAARKGKDDKGKFFTLLKNPYKDYKDFLKRERWFVGGGYHFTQEDETEVAGMKVTQYEIKVDKMVEAPFRIVTWVYHFDDVDFAVQFKVFEDYYRGLKSTFRSCLKSFRRIDRTKALPGAVTTGKKKIFDEVDEDTLTPEERAARRKEKVERQYQREIDALPRGWYDFRTDNFLVLSNGSKRYTKDLARHAEAIRAYLDDTFGNLGVDYVPPAIIRVFATSAEYSAFAQGTRSFFGSGRQVLVIEGGNLNNINWDITDQWLDFKNSDLVWNMPEWIRTGLKHHLSFAQSKGKRVRFVFDSYDKERLRTLIKNDEAIPLQVLVSGNRQSTNPLDGGGKLDWDKLMASSRQDVQAGSVVTYMLTRGNRGKIKGALASYLAHLLVAIQEAQDEYDRTLDKLKEEAKKEALAKEAASPEDAASDEDDDEDEEDEGEPSEAAKDRAQRRREAIKKRKETIRSQAFKRAFGDLSEKDWKRLDRAWKRFVD